MGKRMQHEVRQIWEITAITRMLLSPLPKTTSHPLQSFSRPADASTAGPAGAAPVCGKPVPHPPQFQLLLPLVQKPPMFTQFLRQRREVIAALQAIRRNSFGSRPTRLFASRSSFPAKCAHSDCVTLGVQSIFLYKNPTLRGVPF